METYSRTASTYAKNALKTGTRLVVKRVSFCRDSRCEIRKSRCEIDISISHLDFSISHLDYSILYLEFSIWSLDYSISHLDFSISPLDDSISNLDVFILHLGSRQNVTLSYKAFEENANSLIYLCVLSVAQLVHLVHKISTKFHVLHLCFWV